MTAEEMKKLWLDAMDEVLCVEDHALPVKAVKWCENCGWAVCQEHVADHKCEEGE